MPGWRLLRGCLLAVCLAGASATAATLQVVYPRIEERAPDDYGFKVLELFIFPSFMA